MDKYSNMYKKYTCKCCGEKNLDWSDMSFDINDDVIASKAWLAPYVGGCTICKVCYGKLEIKYNSETLIDDEKNKCKQKCAKAIDDLLNEIQYLNCEIDKSNIYGLKSMIYVKIDESIRVCRDIDTEYDDEE